MKSIQLQIIERKINTMYEINLKNKGAMSLNIAKELKGGKNNG